MPTAPRHDPVEPAKGTPKPADKNKDKTADKTVDEVSPDDPDGKGYIGQTPDDMREQEQD